jgi:Spy/CpxP family protein refolding chaperone
MVDHEMLSKSGSGSTEQKASAGNGKRRAKSFSLPGSCRSRSPLVLHASGFHLLVVLIVIVLLFPANCRAKEIPPGRWWHVSYFVDQLNITDQEKDELDRLFDYNRNRLAELKKQMEDERNELLTAIDQEHLNETSAISKMKKLESTRTLLAATRFSYSLEVRKLLGYERFQQLKTLYRNWPGLQPPQAGQQ